MERSKNKLHDKNKHLKNKTLQIWTEIRVEQDNWNHAYIILIETCYLTKIKKNIYMNITSINNSITYLHLKAYYMQPLKANEHNFESI